MAELTSIPAVIYKDDSNKQCTMVLLADEDGWMIVGDDGVSYFDSTDDIKKFIADPEYRSCPNIKDTILAYEFVISIAEQLRR